MATGFLTFQVVPTLELSEGSQSSGSPGKRGGRFCLGRDSVHLCDQISVRAAKTHKGKGFEVLPIVVRGEVHFRAGMGRHFQWHLDGGAQVQGDVWIRANDELFPCSFSCQSNAVSF